MRSSVAFGSELRADIEAGKQEALIRGIAATAALWFQQAGVDIRSCDAIGASHCIAASPGAGGLLAAALDLVAVLRLSPQGREALADLRSKPIPQKGKAP